MTLNNTIRSSEGNVTETEANCSKAILVSGVQTSAFIILGSAVAGVPMVPSVGLGLAGGLAAATILIAFREMAHEVVERMESRRSELTNPPERKSDAPVAKRPLIGPTPEA
jgi:hypothetical protein